MQRKNLRTFGGRGMFGAYLSHHARKNSAVLMLGALFVLGVGLGALLARSEPQSAEPLLKLVSGFLERRRVQTPMQNFYSSLFSSLSFVGALFVFGFCAVGQPAIIAAPIFRGLGYGFSAASLYATYGVRAAGFVAVFVLPGMLFSSVAILFCAKEALRMSTGLFSALRGAKEEGLSVKIYIARFLVAGAWCTVCALLEAFLYFIFANNIVLG